MKNILLVPVLTLLFINLPAFATELSLESAAPRSAGLNEKMFEGSFEKVVCVSVDQMQVRGEDFANSIFAVKNFSPVKVFQGWGESKRTAMVNGAAVTFVKVQFPSSDDKTGWVAEHLLRPRSHCEGAVANRSRDLVSKLSIAGVRGLNDPACCVFPVKGRPTADFDTAQRRFGARRSGGARTHAACDLYRFKNEGILSVADGEVLRDPYPFYQGTDALEVRHDGGFVVRYGEIAQRRAAGVHGGARIRGGQVVGYMGKVNSNCCEPMLHFELYSGAQNGSLNTRSNKYQRRSDLMNPTAYLKRWEANAFRDRR